MVVPKFILLVVLFVVALKGGNAYGRTPKEECIFQSKVDRNVILEMDKTIVFPSRPTEKFLIYIKCLFEALYFLNECGEISIDAVLDNFGGQTRYPIEDIKEALAPCRNLPKQYSRKWMAYVAGKCIYKQAKDLTDRKEAELNSRRFYMGGDVNSSTNVCGMESEVDKKDVLKIQKLRYPSPNSKFLKFIDCVFEKEEYFTPTGEVSIDAIIDSFRDMGVINTEEYEEALAPCRYLPKENSRAMTAYEAGKCVVKHGKDLKDRKAAEALAKAKSFFSALYFLTVVLVMQKI